MTDSVARTIVCESCGVTTPKRGNGLQKYCVPCSEIKSGERQKRFMSKYRARPAVRRRAYQLGKAKVEAAKEAGLARTEKRSFGDAFPISHEPEWAVFVAVPFSYAASKNYIYGITDRGHVFKRKESRAFRDGIAISLKAALRGQKIAHNKLWISIHVEKPNHRGDAVNVVDLVCDAVKDAVPVDDRWYSIRQLDWSINKDTPRLFIGISQDTDEDVQACSACGHILPLDDFNKKAGTHLGRDRTCRLCRAAGRKIAKARQ